MQLKRHKLKSTPSRSLDASSLASLVRCHGKISLVIHMRQNVRRRNLISRVSSRGFLRLFRPIGFDIHLGEKETKGPMSHQLEAAVVPYLILGEVDCNHPTP